MDSWNPIMAEQHIKRIPAWQLIAAEVVAILFLLGAGWLTAVILLSLER